MSEDIFEDKGKIKDWFEEKNYLKLATRFFQISLASIFLLGLSIGFGFAYEFKSNKQAIAISFLILCLFLVVSFAVKIFMKNNNHLISTNSNRD